MPSRMDYKYKRVAVPFPPHLFNQHDSSSSVSSADQSASASPAHHKQSSLSLHAPLLTQSFPSAPTVYTDTSSSSSAPPTTTHTYTRFPAVGPPRPFSSAQSVRPRIVRAEEDDTDEDGSRDEQLRDGLGAGRDDLSDTSSSYSAFSRSRDDLDRIRQEKEARLKDEERRRSEERARTEKVTAIAQKAAQIKLQAASAEKAKRKEEEDELRAVVAQVQAREAKQRQSKQSDLQRRELEQAERRQAEERKEQEEKSQMEREKEASMRRVHNSSMAPLGRPRRDTQAASPPPPTSSSQSSGNSSSLLPPSSAASKRPVRSDLLASSLPTNPSYYPTHIHSLLSTAFLPPLSRLFKHYHQRAPSSSASPAYVEMAGGVRASVLSSGDWLLMMSECAVSGVLLSKDGLKRIFMMAVRTERKRGSGGELDDESDERKNGLGLGRFLKSLWCVARSVGGSERTDDSESGRQEADVRVMLALLEYIRHHATPQRLGAQLKLQWPDMTLKEAVELHSRSTPAAPQTAAQASRPVKRPEPKKTPSVDTAPLTNTNSSNTNHHTATTTTPTKSPHPPTSSSAQPSVPATTDDAAERERKERKRARLKMRVEQYRREQEEKDRAKADEERQRKSEEAEQEAERRRREERSREEEKRRIADFKARRKEEVEEMARAEAEKAERDERERKRALELYMKQKADRKRREEAEQRQRLMHFHQQLYAQEAADNIADDINSSAEQQQPPQREERKRRQWEKQPSQQSLPVVEPLAASNIVASRIPAPSAAAVSIYSSPPLFSVPPIVHRGADNEDDSLSVGGEGAGMDNGVDPNEETF